MKRMWLVAVVVTISVFRVPSFAESPVAPVGSHSGPQTPAVSVAPPPYVAPQTDRNAKLFQLISACLVDRPGANQAVEELLRRTGR